MKISELKKLMQQNLLFTEICILGLIITIGAIAFHFTEGRSILDSFYFIIAATSTVGFGDITPKTMIGKVLFMVYTAIGIPFFVSIGGLMLETRFKSNAEKYIRRIHTEIHETEDEIVLIEKNIRKLKDPVLNTEERIETLEKEVKAIEETAPIKEIKIIPRRKRKVL